MGSVVQITEYPRRRESPPPERPFGGAEILLLPVVQQIRDQPPVCSGKQRF
ncbi:MAG TPA: hypothetical protein VLA00_17960 [Xanthobacteraceae bacterium]|nr:hypothetical protein [Xanthobacteraceae bacterium]